MKKIRNTEHKNPQIESGEYKVETRDGLSVRIICWDRVAKENTDADLNLCVLVQEDGGEAIYYYHQTGEKLARDEQYDLFIVTPEPELSEFEKGYMRIVHKMKPEDFNDEGLKIAKEEAAELLALARKELCEQIVDHTKEAYENGKAEALKEIEQDPESSYAFKRGVEYGKEDALKDLPRWINDDYSPKESTMIDISGLYGLVLRRHGKLLRISDLDKLPGFKED